MADPDLLTTVTSYQSLPITNFPAGPTLVTVFVNGMPSTSKLLMVNPYLAYLPTIRK